MNRQFLKISDYLAAMKVENFDSRLDADKAIAKVRVDSRLVTEGDVFFALKGQNENGERYIENALENGAQLVIASNTCEYDDYRVCRVENPFEFLKEFARDRLEKIKSKIVAVTGSVGKTSTKNCIAAVLSSRYKVHYSKGNYNTITGLCMTVLESPFDTEVMVLEMGVDTVGEMDELTSVANPDIAVITNIGESHLERFGSKQVIFEEKTKIFARFAEGSTLILNGDDEFLSKIRSDIFSIKRVFLNGEPSEDSKSNYKIREITFDRRGTAFKLGVSGQFVDFKIPGIGAHMCLNASFAVLAGNTLGLRNREIRDALSRVGSEKHRFELIELDSFAIIDDCYNSSYISLKAALESAELIKEKRLIAVIGDILEIGKFPDEEHALIGEKLGSLNIDKVYFFGDLMKNAHKTYAGESETYDESSFEAMLQALKLEIKKGDLILVKASRSIRLERVVDYLKQQAIN